MERRYGMVALIGSFVILFSLIVFLIIYTGSTNICTDIECVKAANELLTHVDPAISPCADFYEFACGGFLKSAATDLRPPSAAESQSAVTWPAKSHTIRRMIEEPATFADSKVLYKIKGFYGACTNETAIDKAGLRGIKAILAGVGGWPVLERGNWRENDFDWKNATHFLRRVGIEFAVFLKISVGVNVYDPTRKILEIRHGVLNELDVKDNEKKPYHEYLVSLAGHFGGDRNRAEHASKEVIEFQGQLKQIITDGTAPGPKIRDPYNQRILSQVQNDFPDIPWVDYINGVLYPTASVTTDESVNILDPEYIRRFSQLLGRTPKRILSNFISWYVIQTNVDNLPAEVRRIKDEYRQKLLGSRARTRREVCTSITQDKFPDGIENSYVGKFVSDASRRVVKGIIDRIKKEINRILDDLDWLDEDAKSVARDKLASVKDYVAYTPGSPSARTLDILYGEVEINGANFLSTVLNIDFHGVNQRYQELLEPVYESYPSDKISYSIKENTLSLPSHYLQGLFFDAERPAYMNYGAVGSLIAYQLSNLLLDGRRYDIDGNLREWSTSQSLLNFDGRTKCISAQYGHFYSPTTGKNVNATWTLDDDTAVYLGKIIAYRAYQSWSESHDTENRLPGLDYEPKQLFWISTAMYECTTNDDDDDNHKATRHDEKSIRHARRSIARYRVIGPLRNVEEFSVDFNCRPDAFMHPKEKCLLL